MAFSFSETRRFYWWWQEMVAQLDDASMKFVVQGENGDDSVGAISCAVMLRPNSDDPSRHLDAVATAKADAAKGGTSNRCTGCTERTATRNAALGGLRHRAQRRHIYSAPPASQGEKPWTHSMPRGDQSKFKF
jgi:hypothetical protein